MRRYGYSHDSVRTGMATYKYETVKYQHHLIIDFIIYYHMQTVDSELTTINLYII